MDVRPTCFATRTASATASWLVARRTRDPHGTPAWRRSGSPFFSPLGERTWRSSGALGAPGRSQSPLAVSHPPRELEHVLDDAKPRIVVADPALEHAEALLCAAESRGADTVRLNQGASLPSADQPARPKPPSPAGGDDALIIYTSGTTGRPKGALSTHANVAAQCRSLVGAWDWSSDDRILHVLPLHHVHGIVNALCCALWAGATCEFGDPAPTAVWERLASGEVTLFMAVPTVYARLIRAWEQAPSDARRRWGRGARGLRLMVSGSAALPVATLERWREITGHVLLERYGMTEIGMALSNPLAGGNGAPAAWDSPCPRVEVRLVDDDGRPSAGASGQLAVRGPQVFKGYWGTSAGDRRCVLRRMVPDRGRGPPGGRLLPDLGPAKRGHPQDRRLQGLGPRGGRAVPRAPRRRRHRRNWGTRPRSGASVSAPRGPEGRAAVGWRRRESRASRPQRRRAPAWGKERLAPYKVPHDFRMVDRLPRNAMGKVRKAAVLSIFNFGSEGNPRSG